MRSLTTRQAEILSFIQDSILQDGFPPTIAEIASAMAIRSPNAVRDHLQALERKGALELIQGASRGIRLKGPWARSSKQPHLPIVGQVAAGAPILAEQHIESYCQIHPGFFKPTAHYLLRVQGMSMRDAGILDGDLLAVHRTQEVSNRQIAVVRIEDEVTVKRWLQHGHTVRLLPENPDFSPIEIDLHHTPIFIEGVGVGVLREQL